jgi:hypothetical protein
MLIVIRWIIKVVEVNQEDLRVNEIIDKAGELVWDQDDFKVRMDFRNI